MEARPINRPRIELCISKRKLLLYQAVLFFLATGLSVLYFFVKGVGVPPAPLLLIPAFVVYMIFAWESWPFFWRSPYIRIHDNGLDFETIGFREWNDILAFDTTGRLFFAIRQTEETPPSSRKGLSPKVIPGSGSFALEYKFPPFCTNIHLQAFQKKLLNYHPGTKNAKPVQTKFQKKTHFVWSGGERLKRPAKLLLIAVYIMMGGILYQLWKPVFFISEEWNMICGNLTLLVAGAGSGLHYWQYYKGKAPFPSNMGRLGRYTTLAILPFMMGLFFYYGLCVGPANFYTSLFGTPHSMTITVRKDDLNEYSEDCLKSDELKPDFLTNFCLPNGAYSGMPDQFPMTVEGKISWFGFVSQRYGFISNARPLLDTSFL